MHIITNFKEVLNNLVHFANRFLGVPDGIMLAELHKYLLSYQLNLGIHIYKDTFLSKSHLKRSRPIYPPFLGHFFSQVEDFCIVEVNNRYNTKGFTT